MRDHLTCPQWWENAWKRHHQEYVSRPAFQAYYLYSVLPHGVSDLLEIGAGSFRDAAKLNQWGLKCIGTDFSTKAVELARKTYSRWADNFQVCDATRLPFASKSFDVSFHNGLFVCFQEDKMIHSVIKEQLRVSKKMIICTVHNAHNHRLKQQFEAKSRTDELYAIRFFTREEITEILTPCCRRVELYPFGSLWGNRLIKLIPSRHLVRLFYRLTYRHWDWIKCERIMAVGWLQ
jgi:hypothetical protein